MCLGLVDISPERSWLLLCKGEFTGPGATVIQRGGLKDILHGCDWGVLTSRTQRAGDETRREGEHDGTPAHCVYHHNVFRFHGQVYSKSPKTFIFLSYLT